MPTIEAGSNSHKDKCCNEEEGDHHTKGQEGDHHIYEIKFNCIPSSRTAKAAFACQCRPHSDVPAMEVEALANQHAIHTDFQSLLDSETAKEDDGLDLFDEAPRYNTDNFP
jgi:hypothetical protein